MHDGEADIGPRTVRELIDSQFPQLRGLPVEAVRSSGTVNAIYRIGDHFCARLPRLGRWSLDRELHWLPLLAPHLTLTIPAPAGTGRPAAGYPFTWAIYHWIDGQRYESQLADEAAVALDLARFVTELRQLDVPPDAPGAGREPLAELDGVTRSAIDAAATVIDVPAAHAAWDAALRAPAWDGSPAWIHGDLLPPNLLTLRRRPERGARLRERRRGRPGHRCHPGLERVRASRAGRLPRRPGRG